MRRLFRGGDASENNEKKNVEELQSSLRSAKATICNAQREQLEPSHQINKYVEELKEVTYDAEDFLDEVLLHLTVSIPLSSAKTRQVYQLRDQLDELCEKIRRALSEHNMSVYPLSEIRLREETCSYVHEQNILGREGDKIAVVDMLLMSAASNLETVSAVCIVGMSGIGKTTLAQLVFNDQQIRTAFDFLLWVWVGEDFSIKEILSKILVTVVGGNVHKLELDELQEQVMDKIQGKRFLLVLDEVWCEDPELWLQLTDFLTFIGRRGSQILVTTCSMTVAHVMRNNCIHELKDLSNKDSWNLFKIVAFGGHQEPDDAELVDIAKQVTQKCANHPLTIKVVASFDINKWLSFLSTGFTMIWQTREEIRSVLQTFRLFTPESRNCFELFSIFPKGVVIEKQVLINMWLALGYLDPLHDETHQSMEEFGEAYCSTLLDRCFFKDIQQDEYGNVISFIMQDFLHDRAQEQAGKEFLMLTEDNSGHLEKKIRHLSISSASTIDLFGQYYHASKTLHTIFNMRAYVQCSFKHVTAMLSQCTRLRVLDLHGVAMETLPDAFDKVPSLRYLNLSNNEKLEKLPTSITKLPWLQVLILRGCKSLEELPEDLSKLVKLRTLDIDGCNNLTSMPPGMYNMTCLRTLAMFVVGGDDSKKGNRGKLEDLIALVNLKGDLLIKVGKSSLTYMQENPIERRYILEDAHLQTLKIIFADKSSGQENYHETLFGNLYPNHDLNRIVIQGYLGTKLSAVILIHISGSEHLSTLSQLRFLKYLRLVKLWNVESIEGDAPSGLTSGATESMIFFPSLEKLVLEWMPKLKGWWRESTWMDMEAAGGCSDNGNVHNVDQLILPTFPCLQDLSIRMCPRMAYFPPCPSIRRLELRGVSEVFCMKGSTLSNPVASESSNSRDTLYGLERLTVYYSERVFNSLFWSFVVPTVVSIDMKYFFQEDSLKVATEAFLRCSSSLKRLSIDGFYKLKSLSGGIEHLTNLQSLSIKECLVLGLEEFDVEGEEKGMPWKSLHSLSCLRLDDIPKLVNLPKGFRYLTALQSLHIKRCSNLEALGECVGFLSSLRSLLIEDCNNLKSLPECLCSLTSLQSIHVNECNNFEAFPEYVNPLVSQQILHINDLSMLKSVAPLI